jgi:hypothetical protein
LDAGSTAVMVKSRSPHGAGSPSPPFSRARASVVVVLRSEPNHFETPPLSGFLVVATSTVLGGAATASRPAAAAPPATASAVSPHRAKRRDTAAPPRFCPKTFRT